MDRATADEFPGIVVAGVLVDVFALAVDVVAADDSWL